MTSPSPTGTEKPITEAEWEDMRAYVNGRTRTMPKWATDDPKRHFRRMMAHFDALKSPIPPAAAQGLTRDKLAEILDGWSEELLKDFTNQSTPSGRSLDPGAVNADYLAGQIIALQSPRPAAVTEDALTAMLRPLVCRWDDEDDFSVADIARALLAEFRIEEK